jgi:putative redox protein
MVTTRIHYTGDLHCDAVHDPSGATLATDAPVDNQGRGESFSPTDLVGVALGSCILTTMAIKAKSMGLDLGDAKARVEKEMATTSPRRIASLAVCIDVAGHFTEDDRKRLEAAAHACPVHKSLHPDVAMPIVINWADA